jgi:uncharacterized protein
MKKQKADPVKTCLYFSKSGRQNTAAALEAIARRADGKDIAKVIIPTYSGKSALHAAKIIPAQKIIVVTTHNGFDKPNAQTLTEQARQKLTAAGIPVLTCTHAFGGIGRSVRKKLGPHQVDEIMAYTLRIFGQGMKVAVEIALMAADAGLVRTDENIISAGGTGSGLDTALVLQPANASSFLDLKIREIICKPLVF